MTQAKYSKLVELGYSGSINDMYLKWLQSLGATAKDIAAAERQAFNALAVMGQNDVLYKYFGDAGATGSMMDRMNSFWLNYSAGPPDVLDTFDRANGAMGAAYITAAVEGMPLISSNNIVGAQNEPRAAYRIDEDFGVNHGVEFTISTDTTSRFMGGIVRGTGSGANNRNCYFGGAFGNGALISRDINTTNNVNIGTWDNGGPFPIGTVFRIEAVGTTLTLFVNGVQRIQVTDATHATGDVGVDIYSDGGMSQARFFGL